MNKKSLTIFTPTYNRSNVLERLYRSLVSQSNQDFEWLIVDDGSSDNTEDIVGKWIKKNDINIRYYKQNNGGKQRAHNKGVELCRTELFLCIDSDDYAVDGCVEMILHKWESIKENSRVAGIVAMRGVDKVTPIGNMMPSNVELCKLGELYSKWKFKGDTELVYRTEILRQYPFWVAEGEKFIGEAYVYQQIDQKYELALLPEIIAISKYLNDGYTNNVRTLTKKNPIGYTELKRQTISYSTTWSERFFQTILCIVGCILSGKRNPFDILPYKFLGILGYFPAWVIWFIVYRNA